MLRTLSVSTMGDKQFTLSVPIMGDYRKRKRGQMYVFPSLDV